MSLPFISFPQPDEIVRYVVTIVNDILIYVKLPDYNNIEACIVPPEIGRHHIRPSRFFRRFREGKEGVARVLRVDVEKGYIDLSYRVVD